MRVPLWSTAMTFDWSLLQLGALPMGLPYWSAVLSISTGLSPILTRPAGAVMLRVLTTGGAGLGVHALKTASSRAFLIGCSQINMTCTAGGLFLHVWSTLMTARCLNTSLAEEPGSAAFRFYTFSRGQLQFFIVPDDKKHR